MFARGIPRTLNKIAIRGYGYVCPRDTKNHKQDSHKRLWLCLTEGYKEP